MKCIYAIFSMLVLFSQSYAQELDSVPHADSVVDMYQLGYSTGEAMAKSGTYVEQATYGCIAGFGGSCMGCILPLETGTGFGFDSPYGLLIPATLGGVMMGSAVLLFEEKDKGIPYHTPSVDSLFLAGFKDGYIKHSKSKRLESVMGGCCGGIAIVTAFIMMMISEFPGQ